MDDKTDLQVSVGRLHNRYLRTLYRLYGGELEHVHVLPAMARLAQTPALRSALQYHWEKTRGHAERLRRILAGLGRPLVELPRPADPPAVPEAAGWPPALDAAGCEATLIAGARNLEHHEIMGYLLALNCAQILRETAAAELLAETLDEEYEADRILAALAAVTNPARWPAEAGAARRPQPLGTPAV